jgi:uncharacterized protein YraI
MGQDEDRSQRARQRAARVRRRRIVVAALFVVIVAGGVGAGKVLFGGGGSSSDSPPSHRDGSSTTSTSLTTTTQATLPAPRSYKLTGGVNVRSGPATTDSIVGTIVAGLEVTVLCVVEGEAVTGPSGTSTKWLHIRYDKLDGFVTSLYVAVGSALDDPTIVVPCA